MMGLWSRAFFCSFSGHGRLLKFPSLLFQVPALPSFRFDETVSFMLGSIYPNSWLGFEVTTKSLNTIICYIPVTRLRPSVGPDGRFRAELGNEQMLLEYPEGKVIFSFPLASLPYNHLQHYSQDCWLRQVRPHLGGIGIFRVLEVKKMCVHCIRTPSQTTYTTAHLMNAMNAER